MTVELAQATLKCMLSTLTLDDFVENIKDGLKDKSPSMREEVLKFISLFVHKKDHKNITLLRSIIEKIIQMT